MVFTRPSVVNLFRLSTRSPDSLSLLDPQISYNFVQALHYSYDFVASYSTRIIAFLSQALVLSGKQVAKVNGTLLAMGRKE